MVTISLPFRSVRLALLALLHRRMHVWILLVASLLVALAITGASRPHIALSASPCTQGDSLYVGDAPDNSVKRFDAGTGTYCGAFVPSDSGGLDGPRGILHVGNFLVANQNVDQTFPGEIDQYHHADGKFLGALVPHTDLHAPFVPRGIVRGPDDTTLYVADIGGGQVGAVERFDVDTGRWLGNLDFSSFINNATINPTGEFHPRGLAFGPDGLLYVSLFSEITFPGPQGWILSYNLNTGTVTVVASNLAADCTQELHRPEGLTFGPDKRLYVASFASSCDPVGRLDRILIYTIGVGGTATPAGEIDLDRPNQDRAYAQALVFGPGGSLFVPILCCAANTGAVRRYTSTTTYTNFVPPNQVGGPLGEPWYMTFGQTNPDTLAYGR